MAVGENKQAALAAIAALKKKRPGAGANQAVDLAELDRLGRESGYTPKETAQAPASPPHPELIEPSDAASDEAAPPPVAELATDRAAARGGRTRKKQSGDGRAWKPKGGRLHISPGDAIADAMREETIRYSRQLGFTNVNPRNFMSMMCAEIFDRHLRKRGWRKTEDGAYVLKDAEGPNDAGGTA